MAPVPTPGYPSPTATALPSLGAAKALGGIGCIFLFLMFVPAFGGLIGLIGLAFIGYALYKVSEVTGERGIFTNYLYAVTAAVVGVAVGIFVVIAGLLSVFGLENLANTDWSGWQPTVSQGVGMAMAVFGGLLVMWGMLLASAVFVKRSADAIAARFNINAFRTAGLLYIIGAGLTVVLIGFLLIAIAVVVFAVGFFSLPESPPQPAAPPMAGGAA